MTPIEPPLSVELTFQIVIDIKVTKPEVKQRRTQNGDRWLACLQHLAVVKYRVIIEM